MSRYPRPIVEALPGPALRARRVQAGTGLSRRQLLRRGVAAGVTVWLAELVGGTLAFAWTAIGSVAAEGPGRDPRRADRGQPGPPDP